MMNILDYLTIISYTALNIDILFQIKQIYRTKSSKDLSLIGLTIRYVAILVILIKFISLSDIPLITGQGLIVITFTTYFILAGYYFINNKKKDINNNALEELQISSIKSLKITLQTLADHGSNSRLSALNTGYRQTRRLLFRAI